MNCTGLRARELVNDPKVYPIKGQLVKMKAPWIKAFVYACDSKRPCYFIPHDDVVWVGGTRDTGDYSTDPCPDTERDILRRAKAMVPQAETATVLGRWAGVRPQRDPPRVEKELLFVKGKKLRVVHNYGHGANGITLSWGTGRHAARLAKEWASEITPSAKL
ncbi:D-aspartate oxidase-like isoform X1 [Babylonia areolata]